MSADIKLFIKKISIFIFPFFIASLIVFSMDPFRVWFNYEDFYKGNFVTLNRELVCLKLFERNRVSINYNSFIFGSSRSQAFKIKEWEKYLDKDDKGFHFDASGEGIYGIYNKLRFLDENGTKIKNTLILRLFNLFFSLKKVVIKCIKILLQPSETDRYDSRKNI